MNIIMFSPQFPPNFYQFCTALARQQGCNVLAIASTPYEQLRPELRGALTEYYRVRNMEDYDQVLRAVGYFTHKYGKIDRFESHTEYWLEQDACIRTDFNIPGIRSDMIDEMKHKSLMKQKFIEAGVAVAPGKVIHTLEEARKFIQDEAGYPVVAKPDNGVGAAATYKIRNDEELQAFFREKHPVDYFIEGFISGELYSFDGLADRDGNSVFYTCHHFSQGIMEIVNHDLDMYYYSLRQIPLELEKAGLATVKAFDVRERFFHIEFFRGSDGKIVALEVNMRPPGGLSMDMFNYANDIDLYYQWANVVVNNRFDAAYFRKYHCAYIGRKYNKNYQYSHEEILGCWGHAIVYHEPVEGIFSKALGNYGYIARSENWSELQEIIDFIRAKRN